MTKNKELFNESLKLKLIILFGITIILFSVFNFFQAGSIGDIFDSAVAEAEELVKPVKIQLSIITGTNCNDCFNITSVVESVKQGNVNVTSEETLNLDSDKARDLIEKYNIERLPTVLVFGEIDALKGGDLEERNDALIFTKQEVPYTDAKTSNVTGLVEAILLKDSSCEKCISGTPVLDLIKKSGVKINFEKTVEKTSSTGKTLIEKYDLEVLPAIIFSDQIRFYDSEVVDNWENFGTIEDDGSYVLRMVGPPYLNLSSDNVEGLVSIVILSDETCETCYDPETFHKPALQQIGVVFGDEERIDISSDEGKELIERYSIEKIPTIILTGGMDKYPYLVSAWEPVGTVEDDGAYVFRKVEAAQQPYRDLVSNQIVEPTTN